MTDAAPPILGRVSSKALHTRLFLGQMSPFAASGPLLRRLDHVPIHAHVASKRTGWINGPVHTAHCRQAFGGVSGRGDQGRVGGTKWVGGGRRWWYMQVHVCVCVCVVFTFAYYSLPNWLRGCRDRGRSATASSKVHQQSFARFRTAILAFPATSIWRGRAPGTLFSEEMGDESSQVVLSFLPTRLWFPSDGAQTLRECNPKSLPLQEYNPKRWNSQAVPKSRQTLLPSPAQVSSSRARGDGEAIGAGEMPGLVDEWCLFVSGAALVCFPFKNSLVVIAVDS